MSLPAYRPMLAVPASRIFADPGWCFELKWDGVRALLSWDGTDVRLVGRRGTDTTNRYPELTGPPADRPVVLDGEIVALDAGGRPSFERLQRRMHLTERRAVARMMSEVPVAYVVFDVLHHGAPLVGEPLSVRQRRLAALDLPPPLIRSDVVVGDGPALWEAVQDRDLEGVVAKRLAGPYRPGVRSPDWQKVANVQTAKAVVGGFTPGRGGRSGSFGSLLLGLWDGDRLRWIGSVGTGFGEAELRDVRAALDEMPEDRCPFHPDSDLPAGSMWVTPSLVASVGFRDWTSVGRLRHPRFRGFTADPVAAITWDAEGPAAADG